MEPPSGTPVVEAVSHLLTSKPQSVTPAAAAGDGGGARQHVEPQSAGIQTSEAEHLVSQRGFTELFRFKSRQRRGAERSAGVRGPEAGLHCVSCPDFED